MAETKARPGPATESCLDCAYYWADPELDLPTNMGFCLRYPPTVGYTGPKGFTRTRFATTQPDWWCGEHKVIV